MIGVGAERPPTANAAAAAIERSTDKPGTDP